MESLGIGQAVLLGILEGLTEFLPVSSTGHLIIAEDALGVNDARGKAFAIFIQLGAILAVCVAYREKLFEVLFGLPTDPQARRFALNVVIAFLPAMVFGALLHGFIKSRLFSPLTVAIALVIGGVIILWVESKPRRARVHDVDDLSMLDALKVGLCQCCALFPGVSRAGATIIGGMLVGLSRETATRFSFFLAMPTMAAAVTYDLYKNAAILSWDDAGVFATGFVTAFITALATVRALLAYVSRHSFAPFGWYRIVFGLFVLWHFW
ncbi:MAG: undecaprenyl-diphosphate phosphatase [Proteobacteria bacterium]|nr:undecaprenyl-diphosphate phosphatase [Burkholderiales bacterium]